MIELMVVTLLAAMVALALSVLFEMAFRSQASSMASSTADNAASIIGTTVRQALGGANHIQIPAVGSPPTPDLLVWSNASPLDGSRLDPAKPVSFQYFCPQAVGTEVRMIRHSNDAYVGAWPMPIFACGSAGPAGTQQVMLSGGVPGLTVSPPAPNPPSPRFTRLNRGEVLVHYQVFLPAAGVRKEQSITHETSLSIDGPI